MDEVGEVDQRVEVGEGATPWKVFRYVLPSKKVRRRSRFKSQTKGLKKWSISDLYMTKQIDTVASSPRCTQSPMPSKLAYQYQLPASTHCRNFLDKT